ncbi:MAG: ATP-binding protein, partial [Flavobacteriales bacterium]
DLQMDTSRKIHPALNPISHESIAPVALVYDTELQQSLDTLQRLCEVSTFGAYAQSYAHTTMRGLVIQLHGAPGTGKTEFCYQLARTTGRDVLVFDVSQARDKYYGESEKIITGIFREYNKLVHPQQPFPILLFNEGDSIFQRRVNNDRDSSPTENTIQTILLNELERFQGILLVTTNTPQHFDKAFERRFQFRLSFAAPGEQARLQLLRNALPECKTEVLTRIASQCSFTAAELQNALRKLRIDQLCGKINHDRAAAVARLLRAEKPMKRPIGFRV